MKVTLIGTLFVAAAMAAPGATSLKRSFMEVSVPVNDSPTPASGFTACVECPCDGFDGPCHCVLNGCCCNWTEPSQPPAETFVPKV